MFQIIGYGALYGHEHLKNGGKPVGNGRIIAFPAVFKVFMPVRPENLQHTQAALAGCASIRYGLLLPYFHQSPHR